GSCDAGGCSMTSGGYRVRVSVDWFDNDPVLTWMVIPGTAKFLKEFWNVSMIVQNLGDAPFTFTGGAATLTLPDGVSLAPTVNPQSPTIQMPDIPGQQSATASWTVRGDKEGSYAL